MPDEKVWKLLEGEERIPRYPSKIGEKRPVRVTITTWIGTSALGASHYSVHVRDDENSWWCESENAWIRGYGTGLHDHLSLSATTYSDSAAIELAKVYVEKNFDLKTHEIVWDGPGCPDYCRNVFGDE